MSTQRIGPRLDTTDGLLLGREEALGGRKGTGGETDHSRESKREMDSEGVRFGLPLLWLLA